MLSLFPPMFAHVLLCTLLYALLTVARAPAVWGVGGNVPSVAALAKRKSLISANLSNQFEWPLFFHVVCLIAEGALGYAYSQTLLAIIGDLRTEIAKEGEPHYL